MNVLGLAPLILIFPAVGFILNGFFGRRFVDSDRNIGEKWSGWFASIMALSAFAIVLLMAGGLVANDFAAAPVRLFDWINISVGDSQFHVEWAMLIDSLSVTMMLVVTGVGSLIHIYAIGYMHGDPDYSRFFSYLNLFLFFMLILVSAANYLVLFVGWEGVGLCSYLLIGFWFDRVNDKGEPMNANAARKAFVVNRIGDFGMILALILLFWAFGTLGFEGIFEQSIELFSAGHGVELFGQTVPIGVVLTAVTALFLLGAAGKSAQIPLYIWLPDAMAGPTPVSAFIHAATMVTAGIYLIVRSNVLFEIVRVSGVTLPVLSISTPDLVAYTGAATALVAGLIAITQFDIKKVLAYSTVSQLGFMIAAAGTGAYVAAMFHLVAHAFFKALLFLSSGSVIHGMEHGHHHIHEHDHDENGNDTFDPQDMRTMGGLRHRMNTTFIVFTIGSLALAGIFPLAGFWSKDEILAHMLINEGTVFRVDLVILLLAAFCTAFYVGRQLKMVFFGQARHEAVEHAEESPRIMTVPLIILAFLTIVGGLFNFPFFREAMVTHQTDVYLILEEWLEHSLESIELSEGADAVLHLPHAPTSIQYPIALLSLVIALGGLALAWYVVYRRKPETAEDPDPLESTPLWWFAKLPLNTLYMNYFVPAFNQLAYWLAYPLDWTFWHDWFHDRVIRDSFVNFANWLSGAFDARVIDNGLVNGTGRLARWSADQLRVTQTGYVRNYALAVFLGVVVLLAYIIVIAN